MATDASSMPGYTRMVQAVPLDGQEAVEARQAKLRTGLATAFVVYLLAGVGVYWFSEDWNPLQSLVVALSILTGCGYGHLWPGSSLGICFTTFYILAGMVLFAGIAGQILDWVFQDQLTSLLSLAKAAKVGQTSTEDSDNILHQHREFRARKRRHFIVGCVNVVALYSFAYALLVFYWQKPAIHSVHVAAIIVLKLDSLCHLEEIECSAGWHSTSGGSGLDDALSIGWTILTYSVVGHFLVSASAYLLGDMEGQVGKIVHMTDERLERMDVNSDGKVTRSEYLRDRMTRAGLISESEIDSILKAFDDLDKDGTGYLNKKDVPSPP